MPVEDKKAAVRRFYGEVVINARTVDALGELQIPDGVDHTFGSQAVLREWSTRPSRPARRGPRSDRRGGPGRRSSELHRHQGEFVGIPATGRTTTTSGVCWFRMEGGEQAAWTSGDYAAVGVWLLLTTAEQLCQAVDLRTGERSLDVACGNGNAALPAARRFCQVVGVDYVPELLEGARRCAAAERLDVIFQKGEI